jgi:hypothetical protein
MSRKFDRQLQINRKALQIIEDPATLHYLGSQLIRRKPRLMRRFCLEAIPLRSSRAEHQDNQGQMKQQHNKPVEEHLADLSSPDFRSHVYAVSAIVEEHN